MEEHPGLPSSAPVKRPNLLTVLCILTFIGSGLGLFSNLMMGMMYDAFQLMIAENADLFAEMPGMEIFEQAGRSFFIWSALTYALSLLGAWIMWNLRKPGFHLYTIAQIIQVMLPNIYFGIPGIPWAGIILSGTFVVLYGLNLKHMT